MKRIRRPRSEYEALLARRESEGLSYKQLSVETGIPVPTLAQRLGKLKKERDAKSAFIELPPVYGATASGVEVVLPSGSRVAVSRGFDAQVLQQVISALGC